MNSRKLIGLAVCLIASLGIINVKAASLDAFGSQVSPLKAFNGYSANWSGYTIVAGGEIATTGTGNLYWNSTQDNPIYPYTVSYVYGEWDVPEIQAGTTGFIGDVSVWVGIDGYASNSVEQLGTSSIYDPSTGMKIYYAWWEMYPKFSHRISALPVSPGDHIKAYVRFIPLGASPKNVDRGNFVLSLTDETTGRSFTIVQGPLRPGTYLRSSAEWVVERAAYLDRRTKQEVFAELPEFDTVTFTNARATVTAPDGVDIHYDRMYMRAPYPPGFGIGDAYGTSSTLYTIASTTMKTSNLLSTPGSFSVSWVEYGTDVADAWNTIYAEPEDTPVT